MRGAPKVYKEKIISKCITLRKEGKSKRQIAKVVGVTPAFVNAHLPLSVEKEAVKIRRVIYVKKRITNELRPVNLKKKKLPSNILQISQNLSSELQDLIKEQNNEDTNTIFTRTVSLHSWREDYRNE